ncbi:MULTISPECIES: JAB domain-containing protein [Colwellia]|uniref:DNA repair protein RadC n=1 Tax=Colwellia marinimaniae TaxID=1513592 RepID=A0ABQ0MWD7_9GAMM|nr:MULTISPECIES: JAB domain-containing protein [Colwellia]GAW96670.1 DNA repair protein RadC [Colwellia marinimaniae]
MAILREIEVRYKFTEVSCDITGQKLESPELVYAAFNFLKYEAKEKFIVINLNNQHGIMNYETVATGTVNSIKLRPCEVLRTAVLLNAPAVILVHNHPSGYPDPSKSDIAITSKIVECGKLLGIDVLDHIIIGDSDFVSLKQIGKM